MQTNSDQRGCIDHGSQVNQTYECIYVRVSLEKNEDIVGEKKNTTSNVEKYMSRYMWRLTECCWNLRVCNCVDWKKRKVLVFW